MVRLGTATLEAGFNSPASLQELRRVVVQALKALGKVELQV
jgi:hypothetical protein